MPPEDSDHNRGHKYATYLIFRFPFLSNEIFNCEIKQLIDKFFEAPQAKVEESKSDKEESEGSAKGEAEDDDSTVITKDIEDNEKDGAKDTEDATPEPEAEN